MRLSSAESAAIGSSGSASESTCSSSRRTSSPPSFTRSSATTVPLSVIADSGVRADTRSLSSLGGSAFSSTACTRPVSSRTITNCMRFWSRTACAQPRIRHALARPSRAAALSASCARRGPYLASGGVSCANSTSTENSSPSATSSCSIAPACSEVVVAQRERAQAPGRVGHDAPGRPAARIGRRASDFALRTSLSTSAATSSASPSRAGSMSGPLGGARAARRRRASGRGAPSPPATTTKPPRRRTAGTARTAAGRPTARATARGSPRRSPAEPGHSVAP